MKVMTKDELYLDKESYSLRIKEGKVFIYPTDTIYGIGCDATNEIAVYKLRNAKRRPTRPLSVIAPSKEWIYENFVITKKAKEWCDNLPGPYTLILKIKHKKAIAPNITDRDSVGVRIPNHWISDFVRELGRPIVTSSANITGKNFMTGIDDLDPSLKRKVNFFVDEGDIEGKPSSIIFLDKDSVEIMEREK